MALSLKTALFFTYIMENNSILINYLRKMLQENYIQKDWMILDFELKNILIEVVSAQKKEVREFRYSVKKKSKLLFFA